MKRILTIICMVVLFYGCQEDKIISTPAAEIPVTMADLSIPPGFDFATTQSLDLSLAAYDRAGRALPNVVMEVFIRRSDGSDEKMLRGITNTNGRFQSVLSVPAYLDEIIVKPIHPGILNEIVLPIVNRRVSFEFGKDTPPDSPTGYTGTNNRSLEKTAAAVIEYMGTYTSQGVPDYLVVPGDVLDGSLLADIDASLPESRPVPQFHPDYLANGNETNIILGDTADVWITFVHEGAGYRNVLGYYTYPQGSPPATTEEIDSIFIIFPNVSYQGSGGGLASGDKVYLGNFPANTGIGWVLFANAWNGSTVTNGLHMVYSDPNLNPETDASLKQHNVLLFDAARELVLLGFEDILRDNPGCDQDFNDAIFYITANPPTAINAAALPPIDNPDDADNDGVSDVYDDYPNDVSRAFDNFYPGENTYGSLAFEDLWPGQGDYDFNDLVLDYRITEVTNVNNEVLDIYGTFIIKAVGAAFENGFAFELPLSPGDVQNVSGIQVSNDYISLAGNNLESGQGNAVVVVFDNAYHLVSRPPGFFVNTQENAPIVDPYPLNITVNFTSPIAKAALGSAPYNPFIIVNKDRGREVHLPDNAPTDLAAGNLFNTGDDASNFGTGEYYKNAANLPWAIHLPETWEYPIEKSPILDAHLKFSDWAVSGGGVFSDWFRNEVAYRNPQKIY